MDSIIDRLKRSGRTKTTVVPLRLTPTELTTLDEIAATGLYDSRSAVIRAGLGMVFEKHHIDYNSEKKIESERNIHRPRKATKRVPAAEPKPAANGKHPRPTGITSKPRKASKSKAS